MRSEIGVERLRCKCGKVPRAPESHRGSGPGLRLAGLRDGVEICCCWRAVSALRRSGVQSSAVFEYRLRHRCNSAAQIVGAAAGLAAGTGAGGCEIRCVVASTDPDGRQPERRQVKGWPGERAGESGRSEGSAGDRPRAVNSERALRFQRPSQAAGSDRRPRRPDCHARAARNRSKERRGHNRW